MSEWIEEWFKSYQSDAKMVLAGYDRLKDLELVVVDNSIRESTVGQLRGHTSDDKCKIFQEATKCGFKVCIWPRADADPIEPSALPNHLFQYLIFRKKSLAHLLA